MFVFGEKTCQFSLFLICFQLNKSVFLGIISAIQLYFHTNEL
jgi:hypothetical protein